MSKIENVGTLDIRNIAEELAKEVTTIQNVGIVIESDESQVLLKGCKKKNIGANIKIPKDVEVKIITQNGNMKLDRDFLEGLLVPAVIIVNGSLTIESEVDVKLIDEKVYSIIMNGELTCSKKLAGIIQSKSTVNGEFIKYNNEYKFIAGNAKITNRFLKSLKSDSKLAFQQLIIIEDVDMKLFEEKISNIEVLGKLIIVDEYEDKISEYIDDYYQVNKIFVPKNAKNIKYIDDDIKIDNSSIKKYDHAVLYVDGDAEIFLEDSVVFSEYIEHLICDTVVCNEKTYNMVKDSLSDDVEVEIIKGKLLKTTGSMVLSGDIEEVTTIKTMGKLIIDENINVEKFNENVAYIVNYGLIEVPEDKLSMVKNKVRNNFGKIRTLQEKSDKDTQGKEDILYANMGELRL